MPYGFHPVDRQPEMQSDIAGRCGKQLENGSPDKCSALRAFIPTFLLLGVLFHAAHDSPPSPVTSSASHLPLAGYLPSGAIGWIVRQAYRPVSSSL